MSQTILNLLLWLSYLTVSVISQLPKSQQNALLQFYNDTNGLNWWNCSWNLSVIESPTTIPSNAICGITINETSTSSSTKYQTVTRITFKQFTNLSGSIPMKSSFISSFPNLTQFVIIDNPSLNGTIPASLCNLTQFNYLQIENVSISGTIPDCLFSTKKPYNYSLYIANTNINGSIPSSICNKSSLKTFTLWSNKLMNSSIPNCIGNNQALQRFVIHDQAMIYGTIPHSICNLINLTIFKISSTSISGCIPPCISSLQNLTTFDLKNNNMNGDVPMLNSSKLTTVALSNNSFTGSVQNIFPLERYPLLHLVALNDNNMYDQNITQFLEKILSTSLDLQFLALFHNERISGQIPEVQIKDNNNHNSGGLLKRLQYFAAHDCDLHGSLPQNLHIGPDQGYKTEGAALTLYGNRLSCNIPSDLERYPPSNLSAIILLGNLFSANNENDLPQWISKQFKSASNLYLNASRTMEEKIVFILGVIVGIYALWFLFRKRFIAKGRPKQCDDNMSVNAFLENLIAIRQFFGSFSMIMTVIGLLILYSQTSNYYDCNAWLTTFSLCFYQSQKLWVNYLLLIAIMIFNVVICITIWRLLKAQYAIRSLITNSSRNFSHHKTTVQHPYKSETFDSLSIAENRTCSKAMRNCYNIFKVVLYTIMYLLGLGMIICYVIVQELPDDNIIGLGSTARQTINYSVALLLAFNSAIIVPHLVNAYARYFSFCDKHRNQIIMILRSIKVVILPILASFVLLNSCGKGWSFFWEPCRVSNNESVFNISPQIEINELYSLKSYGDTPTITFDLLSSDDVCYNKNGISDIKWNKCIRSFLYKWTIIIMVKVCIVIFIPIMIVIYKRLKQFCLKIKDNETMFEAQYCMVSVKLESLTVFAPIQPLIIPIMCMAVQSNKYWYRKMMIDFKWKLKEHNHGSTTVPNWFLLYNVLLEQLLMILFFTFCVDTISDEKNYLELHWILISFFVVLDLMGIYMIYFQLNNDDTVRNQYKKKILMRMCTRFFFLTQDQTMWSSDNNETTHLLSPSQRIKLSDTPKDLKSHASVYKSIAGIICLCLTTLAISSLFKHPTNPARQLLKTSPSIRGGNDASGLDYPWMASWRFDDIHCCTGSLIHKNPPIILTAAHCVTCEQTTVDLSRTLTDPPDPNAESHDILYWIQHPSYEHPTISSNDVALVVLSGTTNIEPIELVPPKIPTSNVYPEGTPMDILGYGFIDEADTVISEQLQHGVITSWDKAECQIHLDEFCGYGDRWDNNAMLCGFNEDVSTERGDSGGPGLMNGLLAGINSWSPPTENCESLSGPDYQILDVFVDVGSVRHWIEDAKPTENTYFVGIHVCDDAAATSDGLFVVLHGSNGRSSPPLAMINPEITAEAFFAGSFMVFRFDNIDNIGWIVEAITFESESSDALCIDMVVSGRLDGMELVMGNTQQFWMENPCTSDFSPCYSQYTMRLYRGCGSSNDIDNIQDLPVSNISEERNDYTMIIHVCDTEVSAVGGSLDDIFARMHGVTGSTDWFQLKNSAMNTTFVSDGIFIFNVDATTDIGVNIDSIDFQSENNDGLCIDQVSAGSAKYPYYWKGSHERFFIDNPCDVNPINEVECSTLKSVALNCYDF